MPQDCAKQERRAAFVVPATAESVALARKMTAVVLTVWACAVDHDATILLVDEVVTNAVLHGVSAQQESARITVELVASGHGLHVEVHDPDRGDGGALAARHVGAHSESGRGLDLVEVLSARWGSKQTPDGKYVYFDMAPAEAEEAPRTSGSGSGVASTFACRPEHSQRGAEPRVGALK